MSGQEHWGGAPYPGSMQGEEQATVMAGQQTGSQQGQWAGQQGQQRGNQPGSVSPVNVAETRVTGRRVVQYIIDYVLVGIIPGLAYWLFDRGSGVARGFGWTIATVIAIVVYLYYWVIRPHGHNGQTYGMQWLGVRVISKDGGPASMTQLFVRGILLIVDTLFFGLVGLITILSSRYRQRVGDHAAKTLVIATGYAAVRGGQYDAGQQYGSGGQYGSGEQQYGPGQYGTQQQPGPGQQYQPGGRDYGGGVQQPPAQGQQPVPGEQYPPDPGSGASGNPV